MCPVVPPFRIAGRRRFPPAARAVLAAAALLVLAPAQARIVERISAPPDPFVLGRQANESSDAYGGRMLSADGRRALFNSGADSLGVDFHARQDMFVVDLDDGTLRRIGPPATMPHADDETYAGALSADGRVVLFHSTRRDLVAGFDNGYYRPYVLDLDSGLIEPIAVAADGGPVAGSWALALSLSADGRYVAFETQANGIVADDSDGRMDVFVRDRVTATTVRVSVGAGGVPLDGRSFRIAISDDGARVCFASQATNLLPGVDNGVPQVFLRDLDSGATTLVSRRPDGAPGNGFSSECRFADASGEVLFVSWASDLVAGDSNDDADVFVFDPQTLAMERVSVGADGEQIEAHYNDAAISADGRRIAFSARAPALPGGDAQRFDVWLRDRDAGTTTRIGRGLDGSAPDAGSFGTVSLDAAGRRVLFSSTASNLVADDRNNRDDVFIADVDAGSIERISLADTPWPSAGGGSDADVSADGRYVVFTTDAPALLAAAGVSGATHPFWRQVLRLDRQTRQLLWVSRGSNGRAARAENRRPVISADGRFIAYLSAAQNITGPAPFDSSQLYLFDAADGSTLRVSENADGEAADGGIFSAPVISADGGRVGYSSTASNLVGSGFKLRPLVWTRADRSHQVVNRTSAGVESASVGWLVDISADGRHALFYSSAGDLHPDASGGRDQLYRKDLLDGSLTLVSRRPDGQAGNGHATSARSSADGRVIAFRSTSSDLVDGDDNGLEDLFVADLDAGSMQRVTAAHTTAPSALPQPVSVSADGRYVSFTARSDALAPGGSGRHDLFALDRIGNRLTRAARDRHGRLIDGAVVQSAASADGRWLAITLEPGEAVDIPGTLPARHRRPDVVLIENPAGPRIMRDGFEP